MPNKQNGFENWRLKKPTPYEGDGKDLPPFATQVTHAEHLALLDAEYPSINDNNNDDLIKTLID